MAATRATAVLARLEAIVLASMAIFALLCTGAPGAEVPRKLAVVSFGLFGDQDVFRSEATGAARIVADRFGGDPVIIKFNTKRGGGATAGALNDTLQATARKLDRDNDVLFLILTTHGSHDGLAVVAPRVRQLLTPAALGGMLDRTGISHKVVVISACYSGIFIPRLAAPDSMIMTAADAQHPSFGCQDKAKWTYFGDAFFNVALRKADNLRDAFAHARTLVREREQGDGFTPSNPQMAGGENVEPLVVARGR
jgi:Peptidase C13 family